MKLLLRYHLRLGDVIKCLSIARQLADLGHEMYFECNPEYHSIFKLCPYVMPVTPGQRPPNGFKFDRVLDLQIWPSRYQEYRASKMKWWDFVTSLYPITPGFTWQNPFDLNLLPKSPIERPGRLCVIAHTGYSQVPKINPEQVVRLATELYPDLIPQTLWPYGNFRATDLSELVSLIRNAGAVVTINTSVDYMADATRKSYDHIVNTGFNGQDDFQSEKQHRHHLDAL